MYYRRNSFKFRLRAFKDANFTFFLSDFLTHFPSKKDRISSRKKQKCYGWKYTNTSIFSRWDASREKLRINYTISSVVVVLGLFVYFLFVCSFQVHGCQTNINIFWTPLPLLYQSWKVIGGLLWLMLSLFSSTNEKQWIEPVRTLKNNYSSKNRWPAWLTHALSTDDDEGEWRKMNFIS